MYRIVLNIGIVLIVLTVGWPISGQEVARGRSTNSKVPVGLPLDGIVVYPDGSAAEGATVRATSFCDESRIHLVDKTIAGEGGHFSIASFDPDCGRVRFTAAYAEEYWLETGGQSFLQFENGVSPVVESRDFATVERIVVQLGHRGGVAMFSVWDEDTQRPIHGGLSIRSANESIQPILSIATGDSGEMHPVLLPTGEYEVNLFRFSCEGKSLFVKPGPGLQVTVTEGIHESVRLSVAVTTLEVESSYDNPKAQRCGANEL